MINIINEAANQYYILEIGLLMLLESNNVVQSLGTERRSNDGSKFLLKTKDGLENITELSDHTGLSKEQLKVEMNKPEWKTQVE